MSGVTKNYNRAQKIVDDFVAKNNPYQKQKSPQFDLRGYAAYIKKHSLKAGDITPEILKRFSK